MPLYQVETSEEHSAWTSVVRYDTPSVHVLWLVLGRVRSLLMMVE